MRLIVSVIIAASIVAGCGGDDDDAAAEVPVTATATYTEGACDYDGPDEVAVGATFSVTVVNSTTEPEVGFALWKVPDGTTADAITEQGIGEIVAKDDQARDVVFAPTEQDAEYELSTVLNIAGTWAVNCFVLADRDDLEYATVFTATDS